MKRCRKCGETKPLEQFTKHRQCKDGRTGTCRDCQNAYFREWRQRDLTANRVREAAYRRRRGHDATIHDNPEFAEHLLGDPCVYCGGEAETFDHIESAHAGGSNGWDNLAPACKLCNASKQDRPLLLYLAQRNGCYEYRQDVAA